MNFGFYVSGNASTLKQYLQFLQSNNVGLIADLKVVISDNHQDFDLKLLCDKLKIDLVFFIENEVAKEERNICLSRTILKHFVNKNVDIGFVFGKRILAGELLLDYHLKLVNFHPAILPSFKGIKAIDQALEASSFLLGNSAHFLVEIVDSGPVIMQSIVHHSRFIDYRSIIDMQVPMLHQLVLWFDADRIVVSENKVSILSASYESGTYIPNLEFNF
jgi:phosphoribosylglycinamide formyltransferase-1